MSCRIVTFLETSAREAGADYPIDAANPVRPGKKRKILRGGQLRINEEIMTQYADSSPELSLAPRDGTAVFHAARRRSKQGRGDPQQCGLACPVCANQRDNLAGLALKIDLGENATAAEVTGNVGEDDRLKVHQRLCGLVVELRVDTLERCEQLPA